MAKFIRVHNHGKERLINVDFIKSVLVRDDVSTTFEFADEDYLQIDESIDQVDVMVNTDYSNDKR